MPRKTFLMVFVASFITAPVVGEAAEPVSQRVNRNSPREVVTDGSGRQFDGGVPRAVRVVPGANATRRIGPRIVSVSADPSFNSSRSTQAASGGQITQDAAKLRWYKNVEIPARMQNLNSQIAVTQATLDSYRSRRQQFDQYNRAASPQTASWSPSDIWPGVETYDPVTRSGPVRSFSPRSSFSHVLVELERRTEEATLELDVLRQRRELLAAEAAKEHPNLEDAKSPPTPAESQKQLSLADAELQMAKFRLLSFDMRLERINELNRLVYANTTNDLREKVQLGKLQAETRIADIQQYKTLVSNYQASELKHRNAPARVAVAQ